MQEHGLIYQEIVAPDLFVTTQPSNLNECVGGTGNLTVVVSGGSGTITYQWQSSPNGSTGWANATGPGSTTATYTPPSTTTGTTYYRVLINASNSGCGQAVSNNATVIISDDIIIVTQPMNIEECVGGTNSMTVGISGGSGTISYQWQSSPDGTTAWVNATGGGSTTSTFTPPSTTPGTTYYRVLVNASNSGCDQAVSNAVVTVIAPDVVVTTQPANINECVGGTEQMTVTYSGGSGTISFQWQSATATGGPWSNATGPGATTATYTPQSTVAGTTYYRVLINASNSGCGQAVSATATVVISPDAFVQLVDPSGLDCH